MLTRRDPSRGPSETPAHWLNIVRRSQILDTAGAEAGLRLTAAGAIAYESLLHLGERAGVTHTTPRIADLLHARMRDARRAERKLRKLRETLVEELRAS